MAEAENWSWKKLILGIFDGRNYGKALVFGLCLTIMLTLGYCVVTVVKARFVKPTPVSANQIGTNQAPITTNNSTETKKGWQLFGGLVQINN